MEKIAVVEIAAAFASATFVAAAAAAEVVRVPAAILFTALELEAAVSRDVENNDVLPIAAAFASATFVAVAAEVIVAVAPSLVSGDAEVLAIAAAFAAVAPVAVALSLITLEIRLCAASGEMVVVDWNEEAVATTADDEDVSEQEVVWLSADTTILSAAAGEMVVVEDISALIDIALVVLSLIALVVAVLSLDIILSAAAGEIVVVDDSEVVIVTSMDDEDVSELIEVVWLVDALVVVVLSLIAIVSVACGEIIIVVVNPSVELEWEDEDEDEVPLELEPEEPLEPEEEELEVELEPTSPPSAPHAEIIEEALFSLVHCRTYKGS